MCVGHLGGCRGPLPAPVGQHRALAVLRCSFCLPPAKHWALVADGQAAGCEAKDHPASTATVLLGLSFSSGGARAEPQPQSAAPGTLADSEHQFPQGNAFMAHGCSGTP